MEGLVYKKDQKKSGPFYMYERVRGIEPLFLPWEGDVIATIRYPRVGCFNFSTILIF